MDVVLALLVNLLPSLSMVFWQKMGIGLGWLLSVTSGNTGNGEESLELNIFYHHLRLFNSNDDDNIMMIYNYCFLLYSGVLLP